MKHLTIFCLLLLVGKSSFAQAPNADDEKKAKEAIREASIQKLIDSKVYNFSAQSAQPINGETVQLTYGYYLRIQRDTLSAYLPYYGEAYEVPMDLTADNGIDFTTNKFTYTSTQTKNGYEIVIQPKNAKDVKTMYLDISPDGYGSLRISNLNRSPISFNGSLEQLQMVKKKAKKIKTKTKA